MTGESVAADLAAIFGEGGALARAHPAFRVRPQQLAMASAVADAIAERGTLLAEAGTGTGKTFAYLVPALRWGGKVIISTGTKTLQDQLFRRDLPFVRDALGVPVTLALLKGRANYVCHHHLERTAAEGRLPSRDDVRHLPKIVAFLRASESGDRGELPDVPENASIWPLVTSTRDNCLGADCAFHSECFVLKARKAALEADVVVVNHHLFFADIMLRDEGLAEFLPASNTIILDEAHQLPDTATLFFGEDLTSAELALLARDGEAAARAEAADVAGLSDFAGDLVPALRRMRLALGEGQARLTHADALAIPVVAAAIEELAEVLAQMSAEYARHAERGAGLRSASERAAGAAARIARWRAERDDPGAPGEGSAVEEPGITRVREPDADDGVDDSADAAAGGVDAVPPADDWIRWIDASATGFQLRASPLSIAPMFSREVENSGRAWIFTSATLAVDGDFALFRREMGLPDAAAGCWESPFDYASQALLYVPRELPLPNSRAHTEAVIAATLPVLEASGGRAFLLFTTLRALADARAMLEAAMQRAGLDFPLLVHGDRPRSELLERFRESGRAVLLGSQSFWEGVDVAGDALSVVVIDKLPFAPPDDPLVAARLAHLKRLGGNPFFDAQLPEAVLSLKQGAGRLIRSETDRGVLVICDPRLVGKPYGRRIWRSLPPMRRTRELSDVRAFFAKP